MAGTPKKTVDKRITPAFIAQAGKGRPKGVPNKATTIAKDAIAMAAEKLGGVDRLVKWAREDAKNEHAFWATIYPKLLPLQIGGDPSNPLIHEIRRSFVNAR